MKTALGGGGGLPGGGIVISVKFWLDSIYKNTRIFDRIKIFIATKFV